jgi:hypothetical protein
VKGAIGKTAILFPPPPSTGNRGREGRAPAVPDRRPWAVVADGRRRKRGRAALEVDPPPQFWRRGPAGRGAAAMAVASGRWPWAAHAGAAHGAWLWGGGRGRARAPTSALGSSRKAAGRAGRWSRRGGGAGSRRWCCCGSGEGVLRWRRSWGEGEAPGGPFIAQVGRWSSAGVGGRLSEIRGWPLMALGRSRASRRGASGKAAAQDELAESGRGLACLAAAQALA